MRSIMMLSFNTVPPSRIRCERTQENWNFLHNVWKGFLIFYSKTQASLVEQQACSPDVACYLYYGGSLFLDAMKSPTGDSYNSPRCRFGLNCKLLGNLLGLVYA